MQHEATITGSKLRVFTIPTDAPEADGTYAWDSTSMVLAQIEAGGKQVSAIPTRMRRRASWPRRCSARLWRAAMPSRMAPSSKPCAISSATWAKPASP